MFRFYFELILTVQELNSIAHIIKTMSYDVDIVLKYFFMIVSNILKMYLKSKKHTWDRLNRDDLLVNKTVFNLF